MKAPRVLELGLWNPGTAGLRKGRQRDCARALAPGDRVRSQTRAVALCPSDLEVL